MLCFCSIICTHFFQFNFDWLSDLEATVILATIFDVGEVRSGKERIKDLQTKPKPIRKIKIIFILK